MSFVQIIFKCKLFWCYIGAERTPLLYWDHTGTSINANNHQRWLLRIEFKQQASKIGLYGYIPFLVLISFSDTESENDVRLAKFNWRHSYISTQTPAKSFMLDWLVSPKIFSSPLVVFLLPPRLYCRVFCSPIVDWPFPSPLWIFLSALVVRISFCWLAAFSGVPAPLSVVFEQ